MIQIDRMINKTIIEITIASIIIVVSIPLWISFSKDNSSEIAKSYSTYAYSDKR